VARARAEGTPERLAPFVLTERAVPRQGNTVLADGEPVGVVTSGTFSPSLEQGIGMAYVRADVAKAGTEVELDVRGKKRAARVEKRPLLALADGRT
jgi:aminomethyltransferase